MRLTTLGIAGPLVSLALAGGVLAGTLADPSPSIRALMHKQYTVSRAPIKTIGKELDAPAPDWPKIVQASETFKDLAAVLATRTPRQGGRDSWRRLTERSQAEAKALGQAARDRDIRALRETHRRIATSCKACHDAHRFRPGQAPAPADPGPGSAGSD